MPMKRVLIKLTIFLLLGAIINVAVAWGCAYCTIDLKRSAEQSAVYSVQANRWWEVNSWTCPTSTFVWWFVMPFIGDSGTEAAPRNAIPWWSSLPRSTQHISDVELGSPRTHTPRVIDRYQAGWGLPFRSAFLEYRTAANGGKFVEGGWMVGGSVKSYFPRAIPYWMFWPGFAINTIFYAAIVWALFAIPGYIKRRRRIKRGVCVRCAYPVGTNEKCTECGAALARTDNRQLTTDNSPQ
jgi:hypothetical protein